MTQSPNSSAHTFHIPVMGTGFTIDTPLRVARYGISSVISLVDDILIEQMRKFHCEKAGEPYDEIADTDEDARARRITAYLNLLDRLVKKQVGELRAAPFDAGSDITRYFEMLPESPLKNEYHAMLETSDPVERARREQDLRRRATPGDIDVNIMTKLDCDRINNGGKMPPEYSDAKSALRGFASSTLRSSIVFSAGMNRGLFKYCNSFDDFYPDDDGGPRKKIVLKVSDYRSAEFQGKFLAKRGLWVSELRIESGLNCGGHAFPTKGMLLGPIMDEFRTKRAGLEERLFALYVDALRNLDRAVPGMPYNIRLTVQGGIGTAVENEMLFKYYNIDSTGWGTPFLLVPEAVNMDEKHLEKIAAARDGEVYLSDSSPLGIPFWNLRTSASEEARRQRIHNGRPGSACRKGYLRFDTELTDKPVCRASAAYQKLRLEHLENEPLNMLQHEAIKEDILSKSCICNDLAGVATVSNGIDPDATPAICCGPNIVNFSKTVSLHEMIDHIYSRISLMVNPERPHMFVRELMIYIDYFRDEVEKSSLGLTNRNQQYLREFKENLMSGIENYLNVAEKYIEERKERFINDIQALKLELEGIELAVTV
ncbi:MAG: hypothetical protein J7M24_03355 [Candidatus Latescibacteria bacterium]|nr:hypothetical protein [Candidatus Latescibacterota bacterium]